MADDRRMMTDRFFGGVEKRLENLQSMLEFVSETNPDKPTLQDWLTFGLGVLVAKLPGEMILVEAGGIGYHTPK